MNDDLSSEFDEDSETVERKKRRLDLTVKEAQAKQTVSDKDLSTQEWHKEDRKQKYLGVDPYSRHKLLINEYLLYFPGATKRLERDTSRDRTDVDVIRDNSKFLWNESDIPSTWEAKLAKRYHDKLFKEYCLTDLSRYKENKIALRWRTEKEVVDGKGQFVCGEKKCTEKCHLASWEVNFAYVEDGEKKNALIKLRLCPKCSDKLNFHHKRRKVVKKPKSDRKIKIEVESDAETSTSTTSTSKIPSNVQMEEIKRENEEKSAADEKELWQKPVEVDEEKSRDDEFDDFLEDLFV